MSNNERHEIGWFRTPIAAAMLSGLLVAIASQSRLHLYRLLGLREALAVCFVAFGTAIFGGWLFLSSPKRGPRAIYAALSGGVVLSVLAFVVMAYTLGTYSIFNALYFSVGFCAYLSGPAIRDRSLLKLILGMLWALLISMLMAASLQILAPILMRHFSVGVFVFSRLALEAIFAGILCRALCALYELRDRSWLMYVLAAVPWSLLHGRDLIIFYLDTKMPGPHFYRPGEFDVFNLMASLILSLLWVIVPTIFIERGLRRHAVSGPASLATPADIPAEVQSR